MILALIAASFVLAQADPHRMSKSHAPTPYSAAEIRAACPEGRVSTYRIESGTRAAVLQTFRFGKSDETSTQFTALLQKADGTPNGPAHTSAMKWRTLQSHASFPKKQTKITEGRVATPAGEFDCMIYTVTQEAAGVETVRVFHFAKRLPGPAVKMTQSIAGKQAMSMTLVRHRRGDEKKLLAWLGGTGGRQSDPESARESGQESLIQGFGLLDSNKDKKISLAEWKEHKRAPSKFKQADANGDGAMSTDEWFVLATASLQADMIWKKLSEDDSLTAAGLVQSGLFEDKTKAADAFARFDRNENGKVDRAEFLRVWIEWSCDP